MAELKLISPLLSNMEVVWCVIVVGAAAVYIVRSTKSGQTYVLKHISVPESQKQVDALMFTGAAATVEDAQNYYKQVAADYQAELETLEKLSASPNIGCYRSYQIEPKEDGVGFEIYLLAEYRQTLAEVLAGTPMTQSGAVNLGVDLCSALCSLREAGLIHRNVKPSNVYLSSSGHYLLGDLGIAKIDELKYCSMPETMLSSFSAPELFSLLGKVSGSSSKPNGGKETAAGKVNAKASGKLTPEVAAAISLALDQEMNGEVYAAISTALHLYNEESVHDQESFVITIRRKESGWNNKEQNFRQLPR